MYGRPWAHNIHACELALDTCTREGSVVLAQDDHASLTRNVTFHEAL